MPGKRRESSRRMPLRVAGYFLIFGFLWILLTDEAARLVFPDAGAFAAAQRYKGWVFVGLTALLLYLLVRRQLRRTRQAQTELERSNRALEAIRHVGQAMVRASDEQQLLSAVCSAVVEDAGYRMAWVGYVEPDAADGVRPVASAGFEQGYLATLQVPLGDAERGSGPSGVTVRTGEPSVCRHISTDPAFAPWRAEALKRGYSSAVALPILGGDECIGVLNIYAAEPDAFEDEELALLCELAADLGYGIQALRTRAARQEAEQALARSQALLSESQRLAKVGGWEYDVATDTMTWTEEVYRIHGLPVEPGSDHTERILDCYDEDDRRRVEQAYGRLLEEGESYDLRAGFTDAAGRHRWVRTVARPVVQHGQTVRVVGMLMDITDEVEAARALQQSEQRYRSLFDGVPVGLYRTTPAGEFLQANRELVSMLAYPSRQALLGTNVRELYPDPTERRNWRRVMEREGSTTGYTVKLRRYDGRAIDVALSGRIHRNEQGEVLYYEGSAEDITERRRAEELLERSQRTLATLLSNLPGIVYRCLADEHWTMEFVSQGCWGLTGYAPEDLVGNRVVSYAEVIHPDDRERVRAEVQAAIGAGRAFQLEYRIRNQAGGVRWVWEQGRAVGGSGEDQRLEGFITDVTARRKAEEARERSEERFQLAMRGANDGMWVWPEVSEDEMWWSQRLYAMFGYQPRELRAAYSAFKSLVHPDDMAGMERALRAHLEDRRPLDVEFRLRHGDGSYRWVQIRGQAQWDESGRPSQMAGAVRDVHERKRAERELLETTALLERVFASLVEAVFVLEPEGRTIVACNDAALRMFGYGQRDLLGASFAMLHVDKDSYREFVQMEEVALRRGEELSVERPMRRRDGTTFAAEHYVAPLSAGVDAAGSILIVVRDISARKRAEENLRLARDGLRKLAARLRDAREQERKRLARDIHDQLGHALTALKMDATLLQRRLQKQAGAADLDIRETLQEMARLTDSTIESVRRIATELRPGVLDDLGLVAALEWLFRDFAEATGAECVFHAEPADLELDEARSTAIFRICQEVLTNAVRHGKAARIEGELRERDGAIELEVSDNGTGMKSEAACPAEGTGILGMRERAAEFGGRLELASAPAGGTTVRVMIPRPGGE